MGQRQLIFFSLKPTRFPSALLPGQDLGSQSTEIQFITDSNFCALTNIGFIQICNKVPFLWPHSHLFVFAFEEPWSYQVLPAKNIVESEFWNHTEKRLQKATLWVPPGNICTRCAPKCLQPGLEPPPCDQAEFSNSDQILKTPNDSPE